MSIQSRSHQYGTVFENWQILELLGQGSGGKTAVFRLKRIDSNRGQSALKVVNLIEERGDYDNMPAYLKKEYEGARDECKDSALQEVYMMADFQGNTNIVDYLDHKFVDWTDESGFGCDMLIRMELLKDLRSELRGGKTFTEEEIIKLGCDICQALILCHGNGILHRDIKPENIFINRNGNYKLGDFGISRIISNAPMSMASTGIGTPEYAAPEQTSGKYDKRVDIYSLGLVLYELSNQQHLPFARSTYVRPDDVNKRMAGVPIPVPTKASKELSTVILKACAFKPEDRYQTVQEFADALCALTTNATGVRSVAQVTFGFNSVSSATPQGGQYSTEPAIPTSQYATAPAIGDGKASSIGSYQTAPATPQESIRSAPNQPIKTRKPPLAQTSQSKVDTSKPGVVVASNTAPKADADTTSTPSTSTPKARGLFKGIKSRLSVKVRSNETPSIEQFIKLAKQEGSGKSKFDVGMAYYEGKICQRNYEQAVLWFTEAVNADYAPAGTALGNCYYHGQGIAKDLTKAIHHYSMARYGGDAEGAFLLGQCYENGHGVAVNYRTAAECYAEAAEKGHLLAMRQLAFCYESSGRGVKHDAKMAFTLYQKAAEAGDTKSMMKMADYCLYGQFTKKDLEKSREWSNRAVELGDVEAMCKLARKAKPLFSFSRENGYSVYEVEAECRESVRLYRMAAERNCEEAKEALEEIFEDLIAEQNQSDANYSALATRLLRELWPATN